MTRINNVNIRAHFGNNNICESGLVSSDRTRGCEHNASGASVFLVYKIRFGQCCYCLQDQIWTDYGERAARLLSFARFGMKRLQRQRYDTRHERLH